MRVVLVESSVVVKVLLDMDDVVTVLGELGTNRGRVGSLIAGHVVVLQNLRQTGDIHGEGGQSAAGGSHGSGNGGRSHEGDGS